MNSFATAALEAGVAAVREQVESLVPKPRRSATPADAVRVRWVTKPTACWQITARLAAPYRRATNLSFTPWAMELGKQRIVLPDVNALMFVSARVKDDTLIVCIAEARRTPVEPQDPLTRGSGLLREAAQVLVRLSEPTRQIAATRALRAVSQAIVHAPIQALADAASAATDVEVLVRALQQPDAIEILKSDDRLGPARLRGLQERGRLLAVEGGTLSAPDAARHLHLSRQAVNKRRQQGALVGLNAGRHGYLYPAWQFVRAGTIAGLEALLDGLKGHDPWMQHTFVVSRNARLQGETPLRAIREGKLNEALAAARAFGEHGAA